MVKRTLILIAVFAIVAIAIVQATKDDDEARREFLKFIKKYNKKYSDMDEAKTRFENFKQTLDRVTVKNSQSKGATFGVTKFSDMTPEEFKNTVLMRTPIVPSDKPRDPSTVLTPKNIEVPKAFDWRDRGAVTPVKDQEQCGSCWAFSVTENIESMWILAGKGTNTTVDLAPQQIVDCDWTDLGCNGGNTPTAYEYVMRAGGLEDSAHYPYQGTDGSCQFNAQYVEAKISTWKYASGWYSESDMQTNLVGWGPLSVCVDASNWQDYTGGVMTWEQCAYVNLLDHCVQLVGYNTDAPTPYWIVRNSWNTDWGVEGYIWLQMGEDTCGIAHEATCSVV